MIFRSGKTSMAALIAADGREARRPAGRLKRIMAIVMVVAVLVSFTVPSYTYTIVDTINRVQELIDKYGYSYWDMLYSSGFPLVGLLRKAHENFNHMYEDLTEIEKDGWLKFLHIGDNGELPPNYDDYIGGIGRGETEVINKIYDNIVDDVRNNNISIDDVIGYKIYLGPWEDWYDSWWNTSYTRVINYTEVGLYVRAVPNGNNWSFKGLKGNTITKKAKYSGNYKLVVKGETDSTRSNANLLIQIRTIEEKNDKLI